MNKNIILNHRLHVYAEQHLQKIQLCNNENHQGNVRMNSGEYRHISLNAYFGIDGITRS